MRIRILSTVVCGVVLAVSTLVTFAASRDTALNERYPLTQMLILSRHNLRAPLLGEELNELTPHKWFKWTAEPGKLSLKGGIRETQMGQYFARRLKSEGLFDENGTESQNALRFYANSFERTIATAHYFAVGFRPTQNIAIEHHFAVQESDPVFLRPFSDANKKSLPKILLEVTAAKNNMNLKTLLSAERETTAQVLDFGSSAYAKERGLKNISTDDFEFTVTPAGIKLGGTLIKAMRAADALTLQYYEESSDTQASFGHELTTEDWQKIGRLKDFGIASFYSLPALSTMYAQPLLNEIRAELTDPARKFTFLCGHDTNLATVLTALNVEDYVLPRTIEEKTPIGAKFVIEKRRGADGQTYASLALIYMASDDLRNGSTQSADITPVVYPLTLKNLSPNEDGLYRFDELLARIDEALARI